MQRFYTLLGIGILFSAQVFCQGNSVLTQRYDNRRLGWDSVETELNTANVNLQNFGLLFSRAVDDEIYAQPLLVSNLLINGKRQDVVFVATVNNSVYAFDADDSSAMTPLWQVNLTPEGSRVIRNTDMTGACGGNYTDFSGNMGIVGTPVIDTATYSLYVVTRDVTTSDTMFEQYFHSLDIRTGAEKTNSPVYISANFRGSSVDAVGDSIPFNEQKQNQRPALLLHQGVVYIGWASHCDWEPYHGWIIGYDAASLKQRCIFNLTPDGREAGIWMSGNGPVVDENGYIYVTTGNGTVGFFGNPNDVRNRGESILKMIPEGDSLRIVDFFTPSNYEALESDDLDYGIDGPLLIPNTTLSLSGSKEGRLYLLDDNRMGRYSPGNDSVLQILQVVSKPDLPHGYIHGTPVYYRYKNVSDTECVYVWAAGDSVTQYFFKRNSGLFDLEKTRKGTTRANSLQPGAMLSVSSNGTRNGTGILWASHPTSGDANQEVRPGTLEALDARDVRKVLWNSDSGSGSNAVGLFAKFNSPVISGGKVYLGTFSGKLDVYGVFENFISADASLKELKAGGTGVPGFSQDTTTYTVLLDPGTATPPIVTATANSSQATLVITQAASVTGSATVVVTAQDGVTTTTYTVNFSIPTAIPDLEKYLKISIQENRVSFELPDGISYLQVSNMEGKILYDKKAGSSEASVSTEAWKPGIYLFKIGSQKEVIIKKLSIVK